MTKREEGLAMTNRGCLAMTEGGFGVMKGGKPRNDRGECLYPRTPV